MKQVGVFLLVMAALGLIAMAFQLQGTFWDALFVLVLMGTSFFIPPFKKVLLRKLHWRLALFAAVICTVIALWQLMDRLLGNYRQFAMPATLIVLKFPHSGAQTKNLQVVFSGLVSLSEGIE